MVGLLSSALSWAASHGLRFRHVQNVTRPSHEIWVQMGPHNAQENHPAEQALIVGKPQHMLVQIVTHADKEVLIMTHADKEVLSRTSSNKWDP